MGKETSKQASGLLELFVCLFLSFFLWVVVVVDVFLCVCVFVFSLYMCEGMKRND
jgi:hypothetical protein